MQQQRISRRAIVKGAAALVAGGLTGAAPARRAATPAGNATRSIENSSPTVHTVLGPVDPARLGVTLMHEHAPIVDWSELYETRGASFGSLRQRMLRATAEQLAAFHHALAQGEGPGAIVEATPIRVGRYPLLMVELAQRTPVHIIACTGFWCEAFAPQHPWALRLGFSKNGVQKLAELYIREIRQGMEDPSGDHGERFTNIKAGIIKCATSTYLRPSERRCHEAAAIASIETGCPITTHTTDGGGLEQAELLLRAGAMPEKVIIGHQGNLDDRENSEANDLHQRICGMGCYVQFDRVGHENYGIDKMARLVKSLVSAGFVERVLLGHDLVPFVYQNYHQHSKPVDAWKANDADLTTIPVTLTDELRRQGVSDAQIRTILIENPKRVLAF